MFDLPDGFDDFSAGLPFFSVFEVSGDEPPGDCPALLQLCNGRVCPTFKGKFAEVMLYRRPRASEERLGVERYLPSKYACCADTP